MQTKNIKYQVILILVVIVTLIGDSVVFPSVRKLSGIEAFCRKRGMSEEGGIRAGGMGDGRATVAAETVEVVRRHRSRVRQRDASSYPISQLNTMRFQSHCQRNAIKSHELQQELMTILYLHSTPTLHNIPCLNDFFLK